jgi:sulfur carrier protein ThiS
MTHELSEDEIAQREFFAGLLKSEVFKKIFEPNFDEGARDLCLRCTGTLCNSLFVPYAGLNTDKDIDTFIEDLMNAFPGMRNLERKGDIIHYDFFPEVKGKCMCPMIALGHIEPTPLWCTCGNYFNKAMFEAVVKRPVRVELLDSPLTTGSDFCRRLIHLKPPVSMTGVPQEERKPSQVSDEVFVRTKDAVERLLAFRKEIEVTEDRTVKEILEEHQLSTVNILLEVHGEIFSPDQIKDRRLNKGDRIGVMPLLAGG